MSLTPVNEDDSGVTFGELHCAVKLSFNDKVTAEGAAVYAKYRHGDSLGVYQCKDCQLWHLTSA